MIDWILGFFDRIQFGAKRSKGWRRLRKEHIKKFPVCEATDSKKKLAVHHILPVYLYPEEEDNPDNLITLTRDIHFWLAHLGSYYAYNPNIREDAKALRLKIKNRFYE